jgi:hypothetical protein
VLVSVGPDMENSRAAAEEDDLENIPEGEVFEAS